MKNIFCLIGLHKWTFDSTIIPIKERKLFLLKGNFEYGSEKTYRYQCKNCSHSIDKVIGHTALGSYYRTNKSN
jgi:hypothetical protein